MDPSPRSLPADDLPAALTTAAVTAALHDRYVSQINYLVSQGREDLIDVIADEFERHLDAAPAADTVDGRSRRAA